MEIDYTHIDNIQKITYQFSPTNRPERVRKTGMYKNAFKKNLHIYPIPSVLCRPNSNKRVHVKRGVNTSRSIVSSRSFYAGNWTLLHKQILWSEANVCAHFIEFFPRSILNKMRF